MNPGEIAAGIGAAALVRLGIVDASRRMWPDARNNAVFRLSNITMALISGTVFSFAKPMLEAATQTDWTQSLVPIAVGLLAGVGYDIAQIARGR